MQPKKRALCCVVFPLLFLLSSCATVSPSINYEEAVSQLRDSLDAILKDSLFTAAQVGIKVISLSDGKVLYDRESSKLFHPASNLKLLTSATALHALRRDFRFKTAIYVDTVSPAGASVKNLYLKGFGNPNLSLNDLRWMVNELKGKGIQVVEGDLIGDVSYFDDLYWGKGWMWDDEPSSDEAFITPLSINENTVRVFVAPGKKIGDPVAVRMEPQTSFILLENTGLTGADTSASTLEVTRDIVVRSNAVKVRGTLPQGSRERDFVLSVWRPELFTLTLFREELVRQGIAVRGQSMTGTPSETAKEFVVHEWPIDSVFSHMNKPSDNLSAENVLKVIAAEKRGTPGTALGGISLVKEYLHSLGIDSTSYRMVDGSGVSHYNLLSPETIIRLLIALWKEKDSFDVFYNSLPVAGEEGTLMRRMKGGAAAGNVRAKTGTLTGVSNLSGYVTTEDRDLLAFSILMEHFVGPPNRFREAQDKIIEQLARFRRGGMTGR